MLVVKVSWRSQKTVKQKTAYINRSAVVEFIMVSAEKGDGRSCIVDEDHRPVLRGGGNNVGRFFFR